VRGALGVLFRPPSLVARTPRARTAPACPEGLRRGPGPKGGGPPGPPIAVTVRAALLVAPVGAGSPGPTWGEGPGKPAP
jgi:hypothetical protein